MALNVTRFSAISMKMSLLCCINKVYYNTREKTSSIKVAHLYSGQSSESELKTSSKITSVSFLDLKTNGKL